MNWQLLIIAICILGTIILGWMAMSRVGIRFMDRYQQNFMDQARMNMADMFLFIDPGPLFAANTVLLILLPLAIWFITGNWVLMIGAILVAAFAPRKIYQWLRKRRLNQIQQQMPDALMLLSSSMTAGLGFRPALENLVQNGYPPLAQELALVLREQHMGVKPDEALSNFSKRVPIIDAELFTSAVIVSQDIGGNLAETLRNVADTLRRRLIMEQKIDSLTSQGKLQGIVMALLPVGIIAFLYFMYPETMEPLFSTWFGYLFFGFVAVWEYLGYKMCVKIMTIDV